MNVKWTIVIPFTTFNFLFQNNSNSEKRWKKSPSHIYPLSRFSVVKIITKVAFYHSCPKNIFFSFFPSASSSLNPHPFHPLPRFLLLFFYQNQLKVNWKLLNIFLKDKDILLPNQRIANKIRKLIVLYYIIWGPHLNFTFCPNTCMSV